MEQIENMEAALETDHDIYRSGWKMLKAHGGEAQSEALQRASELTRQDCQGEAERWKRIATAIGEIAKAVPSLSRH